MHVYPVKAPGDFLFLTLIRVRVALDLGCSSRMVAVVVVGCRQQFFRVQSLATTGVDFDSGRTTDSLQRYYNIITGMYKYYALHAGVRVTL
jgi:hypothetical protein